MPTDSPSAPVWEVILDLCSQLLETCRVCTLVLPFGARADDPRAELWTFYNFDKALLSKLRTLLLTHASAIGLPQSLHGVDWQVALDPDYSLTHPEDFQRRYPALRNPDPNYPIRVKPDEEDRNRVIRALRDQAETAWAESFTAMRDPRGPSDDSKQKEPAWKRLMIVKSDTGDDIARLDGKEHRLTGASDATFLELLQKKQGGPILSATLEQSCSDRPARIHKRLPRAIQRIIDKPGQRTGKKGYRML